MANLDLVLSISVIIMIVINIIFSYQDYSDFWGFLLCGTVLLFL